MEGFSFYKSYHETGQKLPEELRGAFYEAIALYAFDDVLPTFDDLILEIAFEQARYNLDKSKKRSKAGQAESNQNQTEIKTESNEIKQESNEEQVQVQDKVQVQVQDKVQGGVGENRKRFIPPSKSEVKAYCQEKDYSVNADSFIAFYESKGWLVGKSPMKSWKAAVSGWHARSSPPKTDRFKDYEIEGKTRENA